MEKSILLDKDDIEIIVRVVSVPLGAFGLEELVSQIGIGQEGCVRLRDIVKNFRGQSCDMKKTMSHEDLLNLSRVFEVSARIVDPIEMSTIVGYTWDEAMAVSEKLHLLASESKSSKTD